MTGKLKEFELPDWIRLLLLLIVSGGAGSGTSLLLRSPASVEVQAQNLQRLATLETSDKFIDARLERIENKLDVLIRQGVHP